MFPRLSDFNSRPSARGDLIPYLYEELDIDISIHAPPRGATQMPTIRLPIHLFQFTPLREGRPPRSAISRRTRYFNSRPSARGDCRVACTPPADRISIHAPPRGATGLALVVWLHRRISIHAPPRGATLEDIKTALKDVEFQFTPLREGRHNLARCISVGFQFQFTPLREGRPTSR